METIKEKINFIFWRYLLFMTLAFIGAIAYILIALLINYTFVTTLSLSLLILIIVSIFQYKKNKKAIKNTIPFWLKFWLKLGKTLYSTKTQREVFEPIAADWQEEYFEALFKNEIWKARWINVRYTYAFLAAMWMKSPIGDLIQFVIKIAKP